MAQRSWRKRNASRIRQLEETLTVLRRQNEALSRECKQLKENNKAVHNFLVQGQELDGTSVEPMYDWQALPWNTSPEMRTNGEHVVASGALQDIKPRPGSNGYKNWALVYGDATSIFSGERRQGTSDESLLNINK